MKTGTEPRSACKIMHSEWGVYVIKCDGIYTADKIANILGGVAGNIVLV